MIKVLEGKTYRMLTKDKRVAAIRHDVEEGTVEIDLAPPYFVEWEGLLVHGNFFHNWCDARNWVRKAKDQKELV